MYYSRIRLCLITIFTGRWESDRCIQTHIRFKVIFGWQSTLFLQFIRRSVLHWSKRAESTATISCRLFSGKHSVLKFCHVCIERIEMKTATEIVRHDCHNVPYLIHAHYVYYRLIIEISHRTKSNLLL